MVAESWAMMDLMSRAQGEGVGESGTEPSRVLTAMGWEGICPCRGNEEEKMMGKRT